MSFILGLSLGGLIVACFGDARMERMKNEAKFWRWQAYLHSVESARLVTTFPAPLPSHFNPQMN